ncbi:MAG: hypothetical protein M5U28_28425 [Sandaracinaceae bacterium]|nr:hypothetical protein [Sandaracinaceae bacterium]
MPSPADYTPDLVDAGQHPEDAGRDAGRDAGHDAGVDGGPTCDPSLTACDGECVDIETSLEHCGGCGNACAATDVCRAGECFDPAVEVAAAWYHTCARRRSGRVFCWGDNTNGQLGDGGVLSSTVPVEVVGIDDAISIATGSALPGSGFPGTSCAVRRSGELWCWGSNHRGQLNDGTLEAQRSPVVALGVDAALSVANSFWGACVTRPIPEYVVCWNAFTDPPVADGVLGFSAGRVDRVVMSQTHACALEASGRVACWGDNTMGQLGDGTTEPHSAARTVLEGARGVAVGLATSCAIDDAGAVLCWGSRPSSSGPMAIVSPTAIGLGDAVALGGGPVALGACAVLGMGGLACWGLDVAEYARSETESYRADPTTVAGLSEVVSVSVGIRHVCAVRADGTLRCWGANAYGQLGDGTAEPRPEPVVVQLP